MRLAIFRDAVGKRAQAPRLGLHDLTTIVFNDFRSVFRKRIDLGLCKVLTREENMLVKRHVSHLSFGRSLTHPRGAPLRLSSKKYRRSGNAVRQCRAYAATKPNWQGDRVNLRL